MFYSIVDKMLLNAHMRLSPLESAMDMNEFVHVNSTYLPQWFGVVDQAVLVPPTIIVPLGNVISPLDPFCAIVCMVPLLQCYEHFFKK